MKPHFIPLTDRLTLHQAQFFQTNTGIIRTQQGSFLVDPAFTQMDFERIAQWLEGRPALAGFSTHAHYDHLFWADCLGRLSPRYTSCSTLENLPRYRADILHAVDEMESLHFNGKSQWNRDYFFQLSGLSSGLHEISALTFELIEIPGHLRGQAALFFPALGALFAADTLSDIEPPSFEESCGSILDYLSSLDKLAGFIHKADWLIPGHGSPCGKKEAERRLDMDRRYGEALLSLNPPEIAQDLSGLAAALLSEINETRAASADAWQIHIANLQALAKGASQT
ncbi:MAG: hypothetical protein VB108_02690 [Anaerolineaceae bacterium]|nr:hypothetical protein [Anaerolineaceae bacterium]